MAARFRSFVFWRHAGQKLLAIFGVTVLLPGVLLAAFGVWSLTQEKRRLDDDLRENLKTTAERILQRWESEAADWQQTLEELEPEATPDSWPRRLRAAAHEPGSLVALLDRGQRTTVIPQQQLLFKIAAITPPHAPDREEPALAEIEAIEFQAKDHNSAIETYRDLLRRSSALPGAVRGALLHRLARTLRKAGRIDEAVRTYGMLAKEPDINLGSLPSSLVADFEAFMLRSQSQPCPHCSREALQLYERLVNGQWQLERESYAFYSERLRQLISAATPLREAEQRKLALSRAVESYLDAPRSSFLLDGDYWLVLSRPDRQGTLILSERFLSSHVWPGVFSASGKDAGYSLLTPERKLLYGGLPGADDAPIIRTQFGSAPGMLLEVWPANPLGLYANLRRQRNWYAATLGFLVLLLAVGGYLSIRALRAELRMVQMKEDFVATVSHEFRSPLAGLNQLGEMLRDGRVADENRRRGYYELIVAETGRLRRLVENLLDFSRLQDGRVRYRFQPFDPASWLREIVAEAESSVNGGSVRVDTQIPEHLPVIVGDREALSTAVYNLLDNAVKYSGHSTVVELVAEVNSSDLVISVRDHGIGIRDEDKPYIFDKFYRGTGYSSRYVRGAGLGLSLVKHIVTQHGGSVRFEGRQGGGSVFSILLSTGE